jgi:DNA repair protein RecN (Recombination protein N)
LLVEIHGQHDDRALVDTDAHSASARRMFGGLTERTADVGALCMKAWREAQTALQDPQERRSRRRDARPIGCARRWKSWKNSHPVEGEEEELAERRSMMMKAEKMAADINEADEVLSGQGSPVPVISGLLRRLERKAEQAPELLNDTVASLDAALNALADAQTAVEVALRAADFNPRDLEETEERLFALRGAARKYNVPVDALAELAVRMVTDLADLDAGEERLHALENRVREAEAAFLYAAKALSERRHATGVALAQAVMAELPALKLERADFLVEISSDVDNAGPTGIDAVAFHVRTNPGSRPGPIMKVASGGELSRFLLALKVALADRGSAPTLVFDEIDTGVGGAVADAIGKRLKRLAAGVQVLSVTHAPQVAARAATHLLIAKGPSEAGSKTVSTRVSTMGADARREEIARMLAGEHVTDEARAAAGRLLEGNV